MFRRGRRHDYLGVLQPRQGGGDDRFHRDLECSDRKPPEGSREPPGDFRGEARQARGLTLPAFAGEIGVAPPFVTDLEADRRRPSPENLARISEVLGVPLEELEALDPRITPEDKEWVDESPAVSQLLRKLRDVPDREDVLAKLQRVVESERKERGGR